MLACLNTPAGGFELGSGRVWRVDYSIAATRKSGITSTANCFIGHDLAFHI
jgi:hypothetical protein